MKLIKTASGKQTIKMSRKEWESIGKKAGWMKTARFGPYMKKSNIKPWIDWKSAGYNANNLPTEEEASDFNKWVELLINVGHDSFVPKDEMHEHFWKRLEKIKNSTENVIEKALMYQGALHSIEQAVHM